MTWMPYRFLWRILSQQWNSVGQLYSSGERLLLFLQELHTNNWVLLVLLAVERAEGRAGGPACGRQHPEAGWVGGWMGAAETASLGLLGFFCLVQGLSPMQSIVSDLADLLVLS